MIHELQGIGRKAAVAALCAGLVALCACSKEKEGASQAGSRDESAQSAPNAFIERATVMPAVVLNNVDGTTLRLADYSGKIYILVLWAPWSKDCVSQIPAMNTIYGKFRRYNIPLISAVTGTQDPAALKSFIKEKGIAFPVFYNGDDIVAGIGGARKLPVNYVVLRDGTIFSRALGPRPVRYFEGEIKKIMSARM